MTPKRAAVCALLLACSAVPQAVHAAELSKDFTFKRVKVGARPLGARINIQVITSDPPPVSANSGRVAKKVESANLQDWFWDGISADLSAARANRLPEAVNLLQKNPKNTSKITPSLGLMQNVAKTYGKEILLATLDRRVSPAFVLAMIGVESSGRAEATSAAGAVGLMQLIPETAERFKVADSTDPQQNINGGVAYLDWLLDQFDRDPLLALAGYNAGENSVKKHDGVPPFAETRAYVPKVVAAWQVARSLCTTPPTRVTDGCLFQLQETK